MALGSTARKPVGNQIAYLRRTLTAGALVPTDTITRYKLGTIPAGSWIVYGRADVKTAFSAAGTRVLTVGSNGTTANNMLTTITEETVTSALFLTATHRLTFAADTIVYAKLTTAGTVAAAGVADIMIGYIPPEENII